VRLTPDDIAFPIAAEELAREKGTLRAKPNVLFEFGYFVGRL
jgi:predicted nucleotide-binding protein